MSQAGIISTSSGPSPPEVPTQFTTDDGTTAIPVANNLNLLARDTTEDDDDGIRTVADPDNSDNLFVELTNRLQGQATTTDATPTDIITFTLPSTGTYIFEVKCAAINTTDDLGAGYSIFATARSNGTDSFLVGTPDKVVNEEAGMAACNFDFVVGGVGDLDVMFQVTGIAAKTIQWCAVGLYCLIAEV